MFVHWYICWYCNFNTRTQCVHKQSTVAPEESYEYNSWETYLPVQVVGQKKRRAYNIYIYDSVRIPQHCSCSFLPQRIQRFCRLVLEPPGKKHILITGTLKIAASQVFLLLKRLLSSYHRSSLLSYRHHYYRIIIITIVSSSSSSSHIQ